MSTSSTGSARLRLQNRRVESLQRPKRASRNLSWSASRPALSPYDAYTYALRVAYLAHLLSPRARRTQHVAQPRPIPAQRSSSSVADLVRDFSLVRDSKSTRFPHGFTAELDKRITNVLMGKEKMVEFADPNVKRTFAVFLNEFKKPDFRKSMEKDRRVEDLLLIFFSNATKELQKGKPPGDDSWKLLVDRHVALFVRLVSSTIKSNDWHRDRPELSARLQMLESKLLRHDQNLAPSHAPSSSVSGTVEVDVPKSANVKDMPLVQTVMHIFNKSPAQAQGDIDAQKDLWTEKAALHDLKMYQTHLNLNSRKTLRSDDFDTEEAFEAWKKSELPDLSQMMLAIVQSNLELAKDTSGAQIHFRPNPASGTEYADPSRTLSDADSSSYVIDQPVDMSGLTLGTNGEDADDGQMYMYIPPDPRACYRMILKETIRRDRDEAAAETSPDGTPVRLLSKRSTDLLNELGLRWRLPFSSRLMLFLDVVRELYSENEADTATLDAAFRYVKEPPVDPKKKLDMAALFDRTRWPMADFILNQQVLNSIHTALLRDLFEELLKCYDAKPPNIGGIMEMLEVHIYEDPVFSGTPEDLDQFSEQVGDALKAKAEEKYAEMKQEHVLKHDAVDFFHIIQLGKAVLKLSDKIQKRYRSTPEIMQVAPFPILVRVILPAFATDARELTAHVLEQVAQRGEELPVQDGFDLYQEMSSMRQIHQQALPNVEFSFHVEGLLAPFVWRWVKTTEASILPWVEAAVRQDSFEVHSEIPGQELTDSQRQSSSVTDIFRSFKQAIEKIIDLGWNDELQYAKYMTALSKSVSMGMERYAELLEVFFTKEMDRLTAAQEAEMAQTRQEKWMKMARDAMSAKEKVEPFQFLPESFVKLNDIEQAMLLLDKLEKEINVDGCADIIRRKEPPAALRQKRQYRYVFTIKLVEAEDLRACDANGLSDPYVVLGDEYQKRLAKTRIIHASLNPRWDESFDITTQGTMNVTATIWDYDMLGDHDCVGRTTIKLDPSHFSDYLPREYWLDLDTQGRLLVRISMEGEKDDIQFYFGKAFRALKRTERDMTRKITDKLSAYIHYCLSRRALKALTRQNLSMSTVSTMFASRTLRTAAPALPSQSEITAALEPLFNYFNENFAIMRETLTSTAMIAVMTRVWKQVLATVEGLLVPPLSDKPSSQTPLTSIELDIVFKWLTLLFNFFHAVDDDTGDAHGVPLDLLKSPKYHDLQNLNFFYFEPTETLIRTSERMATASSAAAPPTPSPSLAAAAAAGAPLPGRAKSTMQARNLGTLKAAKARRRQEAQAEPSDDVILRILRMRPEAARYLRDRARQKERLAATAAAEAIVQRSLMQGVRRREELERRRVGAA